MTTQNGFTFDFCPGRIVVGENATTEIGPTLERNDFHRAMVICGSTVGSTPEVIKPIEDGIGDRLVGVFDETSPKKYLSTAVEGAKQAREQDVDVLVGVGGGSSLDLTRAISALLAHERPITTTAEATLEQGQILVPESGTPTPVFVVPTTLAGADLSAVAGIKLTMDPGTRPDHEIPSGGVRDKRVLPAALFYDADLFAMTPTEILTVSAMNGFNKGVEAIYSPLSTPITDATAARGLALLKGSLGTLSDQPMDRQQLLDVLAGIVLVQYGVSLPEAYKISIIHAFGHGFNRNTDAHQGTIHGIVTPHVLRYLFDSIDGRRELLGDALGVRTDGVDQSEIASAIVSEIEIIRDDLELPTRLRVLEGIDQSHLPSIAERIMDDSLMELVPEGLNPTQADIEGILTEAW